MESKCALCRKLGKFTLNLYTKNSKKWDERFEICCQILNIPLPPFDGEPKFLCNKCEIYVYRSTLILEEGNLLKKQIDANETQYTTKETDVEQLAKCSNDVQKSSVLQKEAAIVQSKLQHEIATGQSLLLPQIESGQSILKPKIAAGQSLLLSKTVQPAVPEAKLEVENLVQQAKIDIKASNLKHKIAAEQSILKPKITVEQLGLHTKITTENSVLLPRAEHAESVAQPEIEIEKDAIQIPESKRAKFEHKAATASTALNTSTSTATNETSTVADLTSTAAVEISPKIINSIPIGVLKNGNGQILGKIINFDNLDIKSTKMLSVIVCEICKENFMLEKNFIEHLTKHKINNKQNKMIKNTKIDATIKEMKALNFECRNCVKNFKRFTQLCAHFKNEHILNELKKTPKRNVFDNVENVENVENVKNECYICQRDFNNKTLLKKHLNYHAQRKKIQTTLDTFIQKRNFDLSTTNMKEKLKEMQKADENLCENNGERPVKAVVLSVENLPNIQIPNNGNKCNNNNNNNNNQIPNVNTNLELNNKENDSDNSKTYKTSNANTNKMNKNQIFIELTDKNGIAIGKHYTKPTKPRQKRKNERHNNIAKNLDKKKDNKKYKSKANYYNYECSKCLSVFMSKSTLMRHYRTHTGEKPYICRYCSYKSGDGSNMNRHLRRIHKLTIMQARLETSGFNRQLKEEPQDIDIDAMEEICVQNYKATVQKSFLIKSNNNNNNDNNNDNKNNEIKTNETITTTIIINDTNADISITNINSDNDSDVFAHNVDDDDDDDDDDEDDVDDDNNNDDDDDNDDDVYDIDTAVSDDFITIMKNIDSDSDVTNVVAQTNVKRKDCKKLPNLIISHADPTDKNIVKKTEIHFDLIETGNVDKYQAVNDNNNKNNKC